MIVPGLRCALLVAAAALFATVAVRAATKAPDARAEQLEDLAAFRQDFLAVDRSFSPSARAEAERRIRALERKAGDADGTRFVVDLCRVAALADNGHTHCQLESIPAPSVPIGFVLLRGEDYVLSAGAANADLLGARLAAVDGRPISMVRRAVRSLVGGLTAWRDVQTAGVYARPGLLQALGIAHRRDRALYSFVTPHGRAIERELTVLTEPPGPLAKGPDPAWAYQDPLPGLRWRDAPAHGAVVVQLRRNFNRPGESITDLLDAAEQRRAKLGRRNVVLDLRFNDGGDLTLTRAFLAAWPGRVGPDGRFAVLIGPRTFSAGMASAAYLKQAGAEQVVLVGQPPGDRLTFFAEGRDVRLPTSGLRVRPATERDDFRGGCRTYVDCHAALAQPGGPTASPPPLDRLLARMPVAVASLDPDVKASMSVDDWLAGRDPAMAAALHVLGACPSEDCAEETREIAGT